MASTIQNVFKSVNVGLVITAPLITVLSISQPAHAETYKVVDSETGKVVYTDQPQNFANNSTGTITVDKMAIPSSSATMHADRYNSNTRQANGYPSNRTPSNRHQIHNNNRYANSQGSVTRPRLTTPVNMTANNNNSVSPKIVSASKKSPAYQINIVNPAEERAYHKPSQSVGVESSVTPRLQNGDYVIVLIDGKEMAKGTNVNITTTALEVGEHEMTATVINKYGRTLASSSRKFHVIQHNVAIRKKRKKAADIAKYNELPWYKKIVIKNPAKYR